ncbi:BQ2448_1255 [Microbotryum intermedium]|uniref:BQ2448_1255 protein n=1 Tax=Microbotryum intermedium TaxID=269621 RepID=A0A238FCL4_9BASI|nr:BQ2448_1255 [Microbotryum intermedium]
MILSSFGVTDVFHPSCGLMLSRDLHIMYDNFDWALYPLGLDVSDVER